MTRRLFNKLSSPLISILILILLVGCHTILPNHTSTTGSFPEENCRFVKHAMGDTCVPQNPERLVTISDFTFYHALFLGFEPIGNAFDDWRDRVPAYLANKKQLIESIEGLGQGSQPNIEKILKLKPDLIISWGDILSAYPVLSEIAPTVIDEISTNGNDGWREHFHFVAKALGKEDAERQAWENYDKRIHNLKESMGERYKNKTISIMTVAHDFENHASSRNSFVGSILSDVGLTLSNFQDIDGGGGWIQYSSEKFVNFFNGDILFVTIAGEADRTMLNELQSEPLWEKLNAVKEGRVYVVDSLTWQGGNLFAANAVIDDLYKYLINTPWPSQ